MRGPMNRYARSRRSHASFYAMALLFQLVDRISKLEYKPPVTVGIIAVNLILFFLPRLRQMLPSYVKPLISSVLHYTTTRRTCLNPRAVIRGERHRLLASCFIHASDIHVLLNSSSLLYKGVALETSMGSFFFFSLVIFLGLTSHALYVLLALVWKAIASPQLMDKCVVGFSGVLFGLKVILNSNSRYGRQADRILGVRIPAGAAPWAELILASALMPRVSFLGHLCGILAGLIYVYLPATVAKATHRLSMLRHARVD
ncbi:Peptidase S54 rhomboid [Gracilaria domingensis]|nr:Peptidase S54 rhomboid [Gracilaria domingensis]